MCPEFEDARKFWNRVAPDWQIQVGMDGDANRRLNSDPVLWSFTGDVRGRKVLDAGCGTGYLSAKLAEHFARVTGVDFSDGMIATARAAHPTTDFRVAGVLLHEQQSPVSRVQPEQRPHRGGLSRDQARSR
jgi:ubiquinone/menaquinone biosynthesis C-methylase UbiE